MIHIIKNIILDILGNIKKYKYLFTTYMIFSIGLWNT